MANIAASFARIKNNPLLFIDAKAIYQYCGECKHAWRNRQLDPVNTLGCFIQQVLHGNVPCSEVRHIAASSDPPLHFSAQAYCDARARLPLSVYRAVLTDVYDRLVPQTRRDEHLWHGHRTFHVDGSTFSMPDTAELRKAFGLPSGPKEGCGFPVAHLLMLFSASTGLLIDIRASPMNTSDMSQTPETHLLLDEGDILIGDDSFSGYAHLALLKKQDLHGLFPVHHLRIVDFAKGREHCGGGKTAVAGMPRSRWIKSLGREDQLVEYFKESQPKWMSDKEYAALPDSIIVRELRRTVVRPGLGKITITLVTTLLDAVKYPATDLLELRLRRWDVETNIGHLKTTMKMDVLRCKSEEAVRKELVIFGIIYNMVRGVMLEASRLQEAAVSRISFADAYKWLRHARRGDIVALLIVNPRRPHRFEPRCKKRRPKQFDLMNKPREELRKLLENKRKRA
jgi:hypothetical protein